MSTPVTLESGIDLFCDAALDNPYPLYRELRDCGTAAYLPVHDLWFLGRYEQVRGALTDWRTYSSARGIGLNPIINHAWSKALICVDPPEHTQLRKYFNERLGPRHLKSVEDTIDRHAGELAERIVTRSSFDAVTDVAQALPVNVIMDLIGWPEDIRGSLIDLAAGSFDACGPQNARMQAALVRLDTMMQLVAETYDERRLMPGGFGSTIAEAADRGEISRETALGLLFGYVVAAFDTTISGIASGVWLFATHPEQWEALCADPSLVGRAFNEILRMETPIQHFSRVATREVDLGDGTVIPDGARVLVSYASANRDERHFEDPDRFDILRQRQDHVAFSLGNHACAGQWLARLEAHVVFKALAGRVRRFELTAEPRRELNNFTRGFASIPARAAC